MNDLELKERNEIGHERSTRDDQRRRTTPGNAVRDRGVTGRPPARGVALVSSAVLLLLGVIADPVAAVGPSPLDRGLRAHAFPPHGQSNVADPSVVFQAAAENADLALASPQALLSPATPLQYDGGIPRSPSGRPTLAGLARLSTTGQLYGIAVNDGQTSYLGRIDWASGQWTTVGMVGPPISDLAADSAGKLYGLVPFNGGVHTTTMLLSIDPATAAPTVLTTLNDHQGPDNGSIGGALAFNPADGFLYYADADQDGKLFIDRISLQTLAQTNALSSQVPLQPFAMTFARGQLWLYDGDDWGSVDASNFAADVTVQPINEVPTVVGAETFNIVTFIPNSLPCEPSPTVACLDGRFTIAVVYDATPANGTGPANVVLESADSVKFTFFDPSNIELIVKVLNGCSLGQHWWVFAGGLTNVGVSIKVTDTATGAFKNYSSKKGDLFQAFADTSAFPCP
jgi:hypothetical protein